MVDLNAQMQRLQRAADDVQAGGEVEELRETVKRLEGEVEAMQVSLRKAAEELTLREEHAAVREEHGARQNERILELTAEVQRLKLEAAEAAAHELAHDFKSEAGEAALLSADGHLEELKMRSEEAAARELAQKEELKMRAEQVAHQAECIMELTAELELLKSGSEEAALLLADGEEQLCAATALVEGYVLALQKALEETQKELEVRRDGAQMLVADKERVMAEFLTATEALQLSRMQIAEQEQVQSQAKARMPQATPNVDACSNSSTNAPTISHTDSSTNVGNGAAVRESGHAKAGASGTNSGKSRL